MLFRSSAGWRAGRPADSPHFIGEIPTRTLEAELVKSANSASSNAITQSTMGITLQEWVERYSQTQG